jgi:hypothetical protein
MDLILPGGAILFDNADANTSTNAVHPNATEDDLLAALTALERGDLEFVTLQDDSSKLYMQAAGNPYEGYVLEYNDGAQDHNYRAKNLNLSGVDIVAAMAAFLRRDQSWRTMFEWGEINF